MSINNLNTYLNVRDAHLRVVSGNVYAQAMNIGGINVETAHGLQSVSDTGNVTSNTLQFSNATTGFITTANVQIGRDLVVTGNATVSTDLTVSANATVTDTLTISEHLIASKEATVTGNLHVTTIRSDSNVVAEYTGPHDRPLRKYPEVALTADAATSSGYKGYVASASRENGVRQAYTAFDGDNTTFWQIVNNPDRYDTSGNATSDATLFEGNNGEWIKILLPTKVNISSIRRRAVNSTRRPTNCKLYGSDDNTTWYLLKDITFSNTDWADETVNTNNYYNYFVLQVLTVSGNGQNVDMSELELYGHEEGSGSLDTTLKSVYNVPATTGTQLEVYYDAKETGNYTLSGSDVTNVSDLSPQSRDSSATNITIDSTWNAFRFSGSGSETKIENFTISGGDYVHSISLWFNSDEDYTDITSPDTRKIFFLGADVTSGSAATDGISALQFTAHDNSGEGYLKWYHWSNDTNYNIKLRKNEWYHVVLIYKGGTSDTQEVYVNNKFIEPLNSGNSSNPISLPTTIDLFLGRGRTASKNAFKGMIANFRLYSKALNAGQVQELYDYQKDYFLGSKSQVTLYKGHLGVGVTEPSGQLELAGDERLQEYPPRALTGYSTYIEGHGVFEVENSSVANSSYRSFDAFDKDEDPLVNTAGWVSGLNTYDTGGTGLASGGSATDYFSIYGSGSWLKLKLPYAIKLKSSKFSIRAPSILEPLKSFTIYGSKDNTNWDALYSQSTSTPQSFSIDINSIEYYRCFVIHITEVDHNWGYAGIVEWRLFGTPGPTTLDKGSLTLGRSLDVPRISRYDVDTETPRPEKLLVDFDTTVNSSPTDISGKGNHGTFGGSAYYSSADKAFILANNPAAVSSASTHYIRAELNNNETGNQYHSVSLWFKVLSGQNSSWRAIFECGENPRSGNSDISLYVPGGDDKLVFAHGGSSMYSDTLTNLYFQWHHVVLTYDGANRKMYLDGTLIKTQATTTWAGVANMTLHFGRNNHSNANEGCDCNVSNFKLYWQTALEPSEVQKLYRLGRTGRSMVISDTAVGIGKAPEAQLDVRGNLKVGGTIQVPLIISHRWINADTSVTDANYIPFNGVLYENPSGIHSGTIFTCPVKGIYECHFDSLTDNNGSYNGNHEWYLNGTYLSVRRRGYSGTADGNYHRQATSHYYIECNSGDTIGVASAGTQTWYGSSTYSHSHMSIRLITPT